jgi:hypothetical protein
LSNEFKKKVADLYLKRREKLEEIDPDTLESFASEVLAMIEEETKRVSQPSHDMEVLRQSMTHLKQDSALLKDYQPNTDDYDFTRNDCKNLLNSTKRWLKMEGLI